ncbi:hypothetical protein Ancab_023315 [Ancistrocladus abbreviatus]
MVRLCLDEVSSVEFVFVPCPAVRLVVRWRAGSAGGTVVWISFLVADEWGCYLAKSDSGARVGAAASFVSAASVAGATADGADVAVGCCGASRSDGVGHCVSVLLTCPAHRLEIPQLQFCCSSFVVAAVGADDDASPFG